MVTLGAHCERTLRAPPDYKKKKGEAPPLLTHINWICGHRETLDDSQPIPAPDPHQSRSDSALPTVCGPRTQLWTATPLEWDNNG